MSAASETVVEGDLRALNRISIPLMLFLFFESIAALSERIFLSYHSPQSVHSSLSANYLAIIFQSPCVVIAMMAQVFVGMYHGSGAFRRIGPCVWQLIWFSLFSFFLTLPLSAAFSSWYFRGTSLEESAISYFMTMAWGNFLYPLHTALTSFYLGRGKTLFVACTMVGSYLLHLFLSWLLIFGVGGWIPSYGAKGAALGKCLSLAGVCLIFFAAFLRGKNRQVYNTGSWRFSPVSLWNYMTPGFVRAFGYLSCKMCWAASCYVMIQKGGVYLDVLTIGGTVTSFLVFISTGIYKAILTISSNLIGANRKRDLWRLPRSFLLYEGIILAALALPLLVFPSSLVYFFDSSLRDVFAKTFPSIHYAIWVYLLVLTVQMSFCALLITLKEFRFQLYCYLFLLPLSSSFVYWGIGLQGWSPDKLWWMMALESGVMLGLFWLRFRQLIGSIWASRRSIPT